MQLYTIFLLHSKERAITTQSSTEAIHRVVWKMPPTHAQVCLSPKYSKAVVYLHHPVYVLYLVALATTSASTVLRLNNYGITKESFRRILMLDDDQQTHELNAEVQSITIYLLLTCKNEQYCIKLSRLQIIDFFFMCIQAKQQEVC